VTMARFNEERFARRFAQMSAIGAIPGNGVDRPFGSVQELQVRAWLHALWEQELHWAVRTDAVGNLFATIPGTVCAAPAIALGSHHDSVPQGGRFDGPLGVLVATEVLQSLQESGFANRHPLTVISFTAEEPNPFNLSTLGSRTVSGRLSAEQLAAATDSTGRPLAEALAAAGGDLSRLPAARLGPFDLATFLELHIEQGLRLVRANCPLGIVTGICGIYRERLAIFGEANHAGTTRIEDRHDALLAGAEVALAVEQVVAKHAATDAIGTVGVFSIHPGAINVIPGRCDLVMELRAGTAATRAAMQRALATRFSAIERERGVRIERSVMLDQAEQPLSANMQAILHEACAAHGIAALDLFSMAGHDATHIAAFTEAGMLFVPSIGGKSHCPEEYTRSEDIACAAQVLIETVLRLDDRLPVQPSTLLPTDEAKDVLQHG